LEITVQFLEPLAEPTAKLSIAAPGVGTKIFIDASMELAEEAGGAATLLKWEANSRFEGLLSAVSRGLIEGAARKIIADVFQAIRAHFATKVSPEGVA